MAALIRWHKYFKIISNPWRCVVCRWYWMWAFVAADLVVLDVGCLGIWVMYSCVCNFTFFLWGLFVSELRLECFRRYKSFQRMERSVSLGVTLKNSNLIFFLYIIGSRFNNHGDTLKTKLVSWWRNYNTVPYHLNTTLKPYVCALAGWLSL